LSAADVPIRAVRTRVLYTPPSGSSAFPTPATAGVPSGTSLTVYGGGSTLGPGTYDSLQFNAEIDLSSGVSVASPAIFTKCYFAAGINNFATGGTRRFTATDCNFGTAAAPTDPSFGFAVGCMSFSLLRCAVWGPDGIRWSSVGANTDSIKDCYIRGMGVDPDHADGLQALDGTTSLLFQHNTVEMRGSTSTACFYWESGGNGVTVDNNLLVSDGTPYCTKIVDGTGHVVTNNVFCGPSSAGTANDPTGCPLISTWSGNILGSVPTGYVDYTVTPGASITCS
jgi:hypothetical protein